MRVKCMACGGVGHVDCDTDLHLLSNDIIQDGDILWGICDDCGEPIALDIILHN